jgi:hypothetical protein
MLETHENLELLVNRLPNGIRTFTPKNRGRLQRSLGLSHGQFQQGSEFNILLVSLHRRLLLIWLRGQVCK